MTSRRKWLTRIAGTGGIVLFLASGCYFLCPIVHVSDDTLLWGSEYDAQRQHSIVPGPGTPVGRVKTGDRLRVLWQANGKDYIAYLVLAPGCQKGWVLYGQDGIEPPVAE